MPEPLPEETDAEREERLAARRGSRDAGTVKAAAPKKRAAKAKPSAKAKAKATKKTTAKKSASKPAKKPAPKKKGSK